MTASVSKANRNIALDFVKGALVLLMVLYHWINYFNGPSDNRYLRFLTPSFICISGFLISSIYFQKYKISDNRLPKRLMQRGFKILGVFLFLNIVRNLLGSGQFSVDSVADLFSQDNLWGIFLLGNGVGGGQTKTVAFFVLVPISYLLILAAIVSLVSRYFRFIFPLTLFLAILSVIFLRLSSLSSPNLELLCIGLLGMAAGYLPKNVIDKSAEHIFLLIVLYTGYLVAITLYNVAYLLQIVGVFLTLIILYRLGQLSERRPRFNDIVVLLGEYSLSGYITQIALLQLLHFAFRRSEIDTLVLVSSFVLAFVLTFVSVWLVDFSRLKFVAVDKMYRAVFA